MCASVSLGLTVDQDTWLEDCVDRLREELDEAGLRRFRVHTWLSDEWCSPDGIPGIGIPFYLAHPRLMRLERQMMFEVEGGHARRVHAALAARSGARVAARLQPSASSQASGKRAFGKCVGALPRVLPTEPVEQRVRRTPRRLVRPSASGRRLRRDVRGVARAALELASNNTRASEDASRSSSTSTSSRRRPVRQEAAGEALACKPYSLPRLRHTLRRHYERRQEHYSPRLQRRVRSRPPKIFSDSPRYRNNETAASFPPAQSAPNSRANLAFHGRISVHRRSGAS